MSNLVINERLLKTITKDFPRATHKERQARAAPVAVVVAIHNDRVDKLLEAMRPFMREQNGVTDALRDGGMFDLLSGALIDIGMVDADVVDAQYGEVGS